MKIRLVSLLFSIIFFVENAGFNYLPQIAQAKKNALRPVALVNSSPGKLRPERIEVVKREGAEHKIIGVVHVLTYPQEAVEEQLRGSDKIIFERLRTSKIFLSSIIFLFLRKIPKSIHEVKILATGRARSQSSHREKLLAEGKKIFNLDIFYRRPPLAFFIIILDVMQSILFLAVAGVGITYFIMRLLQYNTSSVLSALLYLIVIWITVLVISNCLTRISDIINMDFRDLVYATKLSYLPEFFRRRDLKTATVVGGAHAEGMKNYLQDDEARKIRWSEYSDSKLLRYFLAFFLDIEKSMEFGEEGSEEDEFTVIGTIAELPGPKELITEMRRDSTTSVRKEINKTAADMINKAKTALLPASKKIPDLVSLYAIRAAA